ncbi:hypothetical protein MRX96_008239 [Rhipicephalus microplus]
MNGYERTVAAIFKEVRETRQKAATGDWEVPKLFLVERVMPYYGAPHWEKNILQLLKLAPSKEDRKAHISRLVGSRTIVKNTPFMCKMLWQVKHLVQEQQLLEPATYSKRKFATQEIRKVLHRNWNYNLS